jgi:hypothetical protein
MKDAPVLYYPDLEPPLDWLMSYLLFHPSVARVVPEDVASLDSDNLKQFCDRFPDAVQDIIITDELIELNDIQLERLDKAFSRIEIPEELDIVFEETSVSVPGYTFLHRSKVSKPVMNLFRTHMFLPEDYGPGFASLFKDIKDFILVKQEAANLLLSILADRVAWDRGLDSVTQYPLDFSLLAVNGLGIGPLSGSVPGQHTQKVLASAIITAQVPQNLSEMPFEKYEELRKKYSEVAEPFNRVMAEASKFSKLDNISNAKFLADEIDNVSKEFSRLLQELPKKGIAANIRHWVPFSIFSILGLVSSQVVAPIAGLGLASIGVVFSVLYEISSEPKQTEKDAKEIRQYLANIEGKTKFEELKEIVNDLL